MVIFFNGTRGILCKFLIVCKDISNEQWRGQIIHIERTQEKVRNGGKKKLFFLIDWGAKEQEKRKNLEAMSCQQKSHKAAQKKKKKIQKIVGTPNHQRGSATANEECNILQVEGILLIQYEYCYFKI